MLAEEHEPAPHLVLPRLAVLGPGRDGPYCEGAEEQGMAVVEAPSWPGWSANMTLILEVSVLLFISATAC